MKNHFHRIFLIALAAAAGLITLVSAQDAPPPSSPPPKHDATPQKHAGNAAWQVVPRLDPSMNEVVRSGQMTAQIGTVMFFSFPVLIVAIVAFARYKQSQSLHQTLRLMVEKGVPIPPELLVPPRQAPNDFRRAVLLIAFGVGLTAMLAAVARSGIWSLGLVPLLLGVGYLVVARLGTKPPAGPGPAIAG